MLLGVHMHKDEAKAYGICPTHLGHLDGERLIWGRKFDMEGEASTGRQGFLADHMTTFLGETGDQPVSGNITARKRKRHLDFIAGTVSTFHRCLLLR